MIRVLSVMFLAMGLQLTPGFAAAQSCDACDRACEVCWSSGRLCGLCYKCVRVYPGGCFGPEAQDDAAFFNEGQGVSTDSRECVRCLAGCLNVEDGKRRECIEACGDSGGCT